jgi:hypothetical protein
MVTETRVHEETEIPPGSKTHSFVRTLSRATFSPPRVSATRRSGGVRPTVKYLVSRSATYPFYGRWRFGTRAAQIAYRSASSRGPAGWPSRADPITRVILGPLPDWPPQGLGPSTTGLGRGGQARPMASEDRPRRFCVRVQHHLLRAGPVRAWVSSHFERPPLLLRRPSRRQAASLWLGAHGRLASLVPSLQLHGAGSTRWTDARPRSR